MEWRRRLVELVKAGGVIGGLSACGVVGGIPCGNANPDPCICGRTPADDPQCVAEKMCKDSGDYWAFDDMPNGSDGLRGRCESSLPDAAIDARPDAEAIDAAIDATIPDAVGSTAH